MMDAFPLVRLTDQDRLGESVMRSIAALASNAAQWLQMVQSLDPIMLNNFMKVEWDKKRSRTACVLTNRDAITKALGQE